MVTYNTGIVNVYEVASEIKDVYRSKGTFEPGYYPGFEDIDLQEIINEK